MHRQRLNVPRINNSYPCWLQAAADGSPALDVAVSLDLVDNEGNVLREVRSSTGKMVIDSEGHGEISFQACDLAPFPLYTLPHASVALGLYTRVS